MNDEIIYYYTMRWIVYLFLLDFHYLKFGEDHYYEFWEFLLRNKLVCARTTIDLNRQAIKPGDEKIVVQYLEP